MSQGELVSAYLDGQISRRTLVRRLVAAGVSFGAAVSYAHVLNPERASAGADSDHYPDTRVRLLSDDINRIVDSGKLVYKIRLDEDAELDPLRITAWHKVGMNYTPLGSRELTIDGPVNKRVRVTLNGNEVGLKSYNRAKIYTTWIGYDKQGKLPNGSSISVITQ